MINRIVSAIGAVAIPIAMLVPFYVADVQEAAVRAHMAQAGGGTVGYEIDLTGRSASVPTVKHTGLAVAASKRDGARSIPTSMGSSDTSKGARQASGSEKLG